MSALPHSIESEQALLGCVLGDAAEVMPHLAERRVDAGWFYDERHKLVWDAVGRLVAGNHPVSLETVMQAMRESGSLEMVGGIGYLNECMNAAPSPAGWSYWLGKIRDKWQGRRLLELCQQTTGAVHSGEVEIGVVLSEAAEAVQALASDVASVSERHIKEVMVEEVLPELEEHYTRGKTNLPPGHISTGFDYLDKVGGGIAPQDYAVLAGRPGSGKTTLALNIVEHHVLAGLPVAVFSLEMSRKSLGKRLLFKGAKVSAGKFRQGFATKGDFAALATAAGPLSKAPLWIDAEPSQTIGQIEAKARRLARQHGIKLFVLDYLQLVLPNERRGRIDRVQELTDISARVLALKKRLNVPWLILAQMNRNIETTEQKRVPVLADLKDCGAIEQDADQVWFLYYPERKHIAEDEGLIEAAYPGTEHTEQPKRINIFQAKHREGATGAVEMLFHKNQLRFEDWRQWKLAHGGAAYGKGERENANPLEEEREMEMGEED
jgi:replicative DNA helicase